MEEESTSEHKPSAIPAAFAVPGSAAAPPHSAQNIPVGTISFSPAEFNHTDGLDDNSGNYRFFDSLDGIVTADMRHQEERVRDRLADDSGGDDLPLREEREPKRDLAKTVEAALPVTVSSQGRILIVDTDAERAVACGKLLVDQQLTCTVLVPKDGATEPALVRIGRLVRIEVNSLSITGAFGSFSATATVSGAQRDLAAWFDDETVTFDCVLDLQSKPSFVGDRLPTGYYAPGPNPDNLSEIMAELPEMRGTFIKPQFTVFLKDRCIHSRMPAHACRHCLEICPFGAIRSVDGEIVVNRLLCQGCGGCTLVCPADAVRMAQPSPEELLEKLRCAIGNRPSDAAFPPTLIISDIADEESDDRDGLPSMAEGTSDGKIVFQVDEIGHVGLAMLLCAQAYGAGRVVVACRGKNSPKIVKAVAWQTHMADAVLQGLGMPAGTIRCIVGPPENDDADAVEEAAFPASCPDPQRANPFPPPALSLQHDKRTLVYLATQYLSERSGRGEPYLSLPAGSPFGNLSIDASVCTLCMACVAACPSGALSTEGVVPRIEFRESRCHQCGFCGEACPEGAIGLLPRILCDPQAAEGPAVLHEVEPFRCIACGAPFASQTMIERMQDKLRGHWMYLEDRQLRRLKMCRTCRTRDALSSEDMKLWSP